MLEKCLLSNCYVNAGVHGELQGLLLEQLFEVNVGADSRLSSTLQDDTAARAQRFAETGACTQQYGGCLQEGRVRVAS
jgi:hypothetical protein